MNYLCITVRWFDDRYHGKDGDGEPEWPPSPLRLFQAMLAGAFRRFGETDSFLSSFRWLQSDELGAPIIVAPRAQRGQRFTRFVPNNDSDKESNRQDRLTAKTVCPTLLLDQPTIYYLWRLPEPFTNDARNYANELADIARSLVAFGWGVDMATASGSILSDAQANSLSGERWLPTESKTETNRRIFCSNTLDALLARQQSFVSRLLFNKYEQHAGNLQNGCLTDLPPLSESAFSRIHYRRMSDPEPRPQCVFTILKPDASRTHAFNTARRTRDVAAWIRHAVAEVCKDWPDLASFVHGHGPNGKPNTSENSSHRFQYLPLPTINSHLKRVESIRRVMVAAPAGCGDRINFIRRRLLGHELRWGNDVIGLLNLQPGKDWVRDQYIGSATTWSSVTPVILDGFDDHNAAKTQKLIRKTLANAGINSEVEFEWQPFGFRSGVEPVRAFVRPEKLHGTMVHVRLRFTHSMPGPLAMGAGRYRGFGLMAIEE